MSDIKVIGAGFPRTGTTTLKNSLETLGFGKCYHMKELLVHPERLKYWKELDEKGNTDWDALFDNYHSCVDVPGYPYYKILMQQYPEAKVILTHRPFDQWYTSAANTIKQAGPQTILEKLAMLIKLPFDARLRRAVKAIQFFERIFWKDQFNGKFDDKESAKQIYQKHINDVKEYVPKEKLLVYNVADGWAPLCAFLNVTIPLQDFPHLNKKEQFKEMLGHLIKGEMA